jgi:hypothetical protein
MSGSGPLASIFHGVWQSCTGVPRRVTRSFAHWPAFAIEIDVDPVFEQTPGPRAGTRLR